MRTITVAELEQLRKYAQFHDSMDALKLIDEILARKPREVQRMWNNWQVGEVV